MTSLPPQAVRDDEFLVNVALPYVADVLRADGRTARNPANGSECAIVKGEMTASRFERELNLTTWDSRAYAVLTMGRFFCANAEVFLTAANVQLMLAKLSKAFPLLIVNVLERFPPQFVLNVLRALVREQFSIRDLSGIMEAMLELNGNCPDLASEEVAILPTTPKLLRYGTPPAGQGAAERCADNVRLAMKRYVVGQFAREGDVTLLETPEAFESRLRECRGRENGVEFRELAEAIATQSAERDLSRPIVLLTAGDVRRQLQEAIRIEFPYIAVLGREEVDQVPTWHEHKVLSWPPTKLHAIEKP